MTCAGRRMKDPHTGPSQAREWNAVFMTTPPSYIRYQAPQANQRGINPGVFALANRLGRDGALSPLDHLWWVTTNAWCDEAYPDPARSDPTVYDRTVNPSAQAWFKSSAVHLLEKIEEYLHLVTRYGLACERLVSTSPGRIIYEDQVQVVVIPWSEPTS